MKTRAIAVAAALALAFAGVHADEAATTAAGQKPKLAYGLMMKQGDKLVFSPCRDRSYALVEDVSADQSVVGGLEQVGLSAGKKLYVELLGVSDGLALKASALNLARTDGRCQQPGGADEAWQAAGNAPPWALAAGDEQVLLKRPGTADLVLPYREFIRDGHLARYDGEAAGHALQLHFEQKTCRDASADAVFGWTATLTVDGQTLQGCAWQR